MKKQLRILFLLLVVLEFSAPGQSQKVQLDYGKFMGTVIAEWLNDGRLMKLTAPFSYIDPGGQRWDAPAGSVVDGASIPQFAWTLIGGPFEGKYRNASVIHDVACVQHQRAWEEVHLTFYTAMLASGVDPVKAKVMYSAVYHFGPRWPAIRKPPMFGKYSGIHQSKTPVKPAPPPPLPTLEEGDFQRLAAQIEVREKSGDSMTLEQIRNFK